jgi:hypothetical protein
VERYLELGEQAKAIKFWTEHVVMKDKPHHPMGSLPPEWVEIEWMSRSVERYLELGEQAKAIKAEREDISAELRHASDKTGVMTSAGTVRTIDAKGRVNWTALAHDLQVAGVLSKNMIETYRGPGGKRIQVRENKE